MSEENENKNVSINVEEPNVPPAPVNLTLGNLNNVKNLVDVAITRGAYKPNEVSTVGKVYDEFVAALTNLINMTNANANANANANESSSEPETKNV